MRSKFFLYLALFLIALIVLYFLWLVAKAIYTILFDIWNDRELARLADQLAARRQERRLASERRLKNGCDHEFDDVLGALPPDVCRKCGLARELPAGPCDHVWRIQPGIIPESRCERCGERYTGIPAA